MGTKSLLSMKTRLISTPIFMLSFVSLITACFGGVGIIFSVVAFYKANQKIKKAKENLLGFTGSLGTMKLARIAALISLAVNLIYFSLAVIWIYKNGYYAFQERWLNMLFLR